MDDKPTTKEGYPPELADEARRMALHIATILEAPAGGLVSLATERAERKARTTQAEPSECRVPPVVVNGSRNLTRIVTLGS